MKKRFRIEVFIKFILRVVWCGTYNCKNSNKNQTYNSNF